MKNTGKRIFAAALFAVIASLPLLASAAALSSTR